VEKLEVGQEPTKQATKRFKASRALPTALRSTAATHYLPAATTTPTS
jgi:hypothetical protein